MTSIEPTGSPTEPRPAHQQLAFDTLGVVFGGRYRNNNTGTLCVVLAAEQRHHQWVTIRIHGEMQTLTVANFLRQFTRV
jgi:hypothetical protein